MSLVVVLNRPKDLVNVAVVVRAMKNFDLALLRLVAPEEYEPHRIEGIAHGSSEFLRRVQLYDGLDEALADCVAVTGMTARQRSAKRNVGRPRDAAPEILREAGAGTTALLMGPEDRGLTNDELDRCHRIVTIPTDTANQALNLAQAFTVMAYELFVARGTPPFKTPRRPAPPAAQEQLEMVFDDAEAALGAIEFFKKRNPAVIMRSVREIVHRARLDRREAKLFQAMCREVLRYLERVGAR